MDMIFQVGSLVVTRCTTPATGVRSIRALTGPEAERALLAAELVEEQLSRLEGDLEEEEAVEKMHSKELQAFDKKLAEMRCRLEAPDFPLLASHKAQARLEHLQKVVQVSEHLKGHFEF